MTLPNIDTHVHTSGTIIVVVWRTHADLHITISHHLLCSTCTMYKEIEVCNWHFKHMYSSHCSNSVCQIDWVIQLRFYIPLITKQLISDMHNQFMYVCIEPHVVMHRLHHCLHTVMFPSDLNSQLSSSLRCHRFHKSMSALNLAVSLSTAYTHSGKTTDLLRFSVPYIMSYICHTAHGCT